MCRIAHAREWSTRILHEMDYHADSVFVTLTYNPENAPQFNSLEKASLQRFWKRLRKSLDERKIMYYACGEYGEQSARPHYHAIIFGISNRPEDVETIQKAWPYGFIKCGTVTYDSARYVADYIQKKYSGHLAEEVYDKSNRERPFAVMSRGIGEKYVMDNQEKLISTMSITVHGAEVGLPRYYQKKMCLTRDEKTVKALKFQKIEREKFQSHVAKKDPEAALIKRQGHNKLREDTILARAKIYNKGTI